MRSAQIQSQLSQTIPNDTKKIASLSLHEALRTYTKPEDIKRFVQELSSVDIEKMANSINEHGELPIEIITTLSHLSQDDKDWLYNRLIPFTLPKHFKPLSDPVDFIHTLKKFPAFFGSQLYNHLKLGCEAANYARKIIRSSSTHPDANLTPPGESRELHLQIRAMRVRAAELMQSKLHVSYFVPNQLSISEMDAYVAIKTDIIKQSEVGDCSEFSYLVYQYLKKSNPSLSIHLAGFSMGDHLFTIFSDKPCDDINQYKNWDNAVACDAWSGKVFPAKYLLTEIQNYCYIHYGFSSYNFVKPIRDTPDLLESVIYSPGRIQLSETPKNESKCFF